MRRSFFPPVAIFLVPYVFHFLTLSLIPCRYFSILLSFPSLIPKLIMKQNMLSVKNRFSCAIIAIAALIVPMRSIASVIVVEVMLSPYC